MAKVMVAREKLFVEPEEIIKEAFLELFEDSAYSDWTILQVSKGTMRAVPFYEVEAPEGDVAYELGLGTTGLKV